MSWQMKAIGEVFQVVNGGTPKTGVAAYWGGEHQWITPAEMGGLASPYLAASRRTLTNDGLRVSAELIPASSIILSSRAPIGHLVINEVPMAFNQGCKGLVPSQGIDTKFAYYFLLANVPLLESLGTGATFKELSGGNLKGVSFRFPALPEQQRIVGILDEAFAGIAIAKANAERSNRNAVSLFAVMTQELFPQDDHGPSEQTIAQICEAIVDCEHKTAPAQEEGIPSIRTPNVGRGELLLGGVLRVSEGTYKEWTRRAEPMPGDLILAREAPAGNVAVIPEGMKVCLGQRTVLLRPKRVIVEPAYLAYLLLQRNSQERLLAHSRGATVQHINVKDIRAFRLATVPSIAEQREVVMRVRELSRQQQSIELLYTRKLAALDELKQSLLQQAFSGQL